MAAVKIARGFFLAIVIMVTLSCNFSGFNTETLTGGVQEEPTGVKDVGETQSGQTEENRDQSEELTPAQPSESAGPAEGQGVAEPFQLVSVLPDGTPGGDRSYISSDYRSRISADGSRVVFSTRAENLVDREQEKELNYVIKDLSTGELRTILLPDETFDPHHNTPVMADEGGRVVFGLSVMREVEGEELYFGEVYLYDYEEDGLTWLDQFEDGQEEVYTYEPEISANGRFITLTADGNKRALVPEINYALFEASKTEVFLYDTQGGHWSLISISMEGGSGGNDDSWGPSPVTSDGRFVAFASNASDLVGGDTNETTDVFLRDTVAGTTTLISVSSEGVQGNSFSFPVSLSEDGRYVVFESEADNLVEGDTNGVKDVFLHDTSSGETVLVSKSSDGMVGNGPSEGLRITADGRFVAFVSDSTNLVEEDANGYRDVFFHDLDSGETNRILASKKPYDGTGVTISADGTFLAFSSSSGAWIGTETYSIEHVFRKQLTE